MSILDIVREKKDKFRNFQEKQKNKSLIRMQEKTEALKTKRAVLEQDSKIKAEYEREKAKVKQMDKDNSLIRKIGSNVQKKFKDNKSLDKGLYAQGGGSIFTQPVKTTNPFSQGSFGAPFSKGTVGKSPFTKRK